MKVFGQYWFLQGLVTAFMLFGISAACEDASDCIAPNGVCTEGKCVCVPQIAGPTCATANPCIGETCSNHGECAPSEDDSPVAVCTCETGYTGTKCETEGVCSDGGVECANGGTCVTSTTPNTCTCADGYYGDTCENDIDECTASGDDAHDCDENATCTNTPQGSYTCTCNEGFVGHGKACTASGADKLSGKLLLLTVAAVLAKLSRN